MVRQTDTPAGMRRAGSGPLHATSLRAIRAIVAVAERGSFTAASRTLNVTQPALSRIVRLTEQKIGYALFDRQVDGVRLTAAGELVVPRLERVIWHLRTCAAEIERESGGISDRFSRYVSERHLGALQAVTELADVGAAARALGRTGSLVYRYLRECQEIAGGALLRHESSGVEPTPLGRIVLRRAKLCAAELRHADSELAEFAGRAVGTLTLGSLPLSRTYLLPHAIALLKQSYPHLTISLIDGPYPTLLNLLRHGEIDLLIGALRLPAPFPDVEEHRLFDDELAVVVRRDHPLSARKRVAMADLAPFPWAVPPQETPTHRHVRAFFAQAGLPFPADLVITSSLIATRSLLLESDRITMISRHQVHFELQLGLLEVLPISLRESRRPIGYTLSSQVAPPTALDALIAILRDTCGNLPARR